MQNSVPHLMKNTIFFSSKSLRPLAVIIQALLLAWIGTLPAKAELPLAASIDYRKFTGQALRQMQGEVSVELKTNLAQPAKLYNDFLQIAALFLKENKVQNTLTKPHAFSPYLALTIDAGDTSYLNRFARQLAAYGYTLKFYGPEEIKHYRSLHIVPEARYVLIGARNVANFNDLAFNPKAQAALTVIKNLNHPGFIFLNKASLLLTESLATSTIPNPDFPLAHLILDPNHQIMVVHPPKTNSLPYNFSGIYHRSMVLTEDVKTILGRHQSPQSKSDELTTTEFTSLVDHYGKFRSSLLYNLVNLQAAFYVLAKHPAQVQSKLGSGGQLQINIILDPAFPDEIFHLNIAWPQEQAVPAHPRDFLAHSTIQALYRYAWKVFHHLDNAQPLFAPGHHVVASELVPLLPSWETFAELPSVVSAEVTNHPWTPDQFFSEILAQQEDLIVKLGQQIPSVNYARVLENRWRQRQTTIQDPALIQKSYRDFLEELGIYLAARGIDYEIHEAGRSVWLDILPSERSGLNQLAARLKERGFALQYMGINHLLNEKTCHKLLHLNYKEKRIKIGHKSLKRVNALLAAPEIVAIIDDPPAAPSFPDLKGPVAFDWITDRPEITTSNGQRPHMLLDPQEMKIISVLDPAQKIVILDRHYSRLNYDDLYHRTLALYYTTKSIEKSKVDQLSNRSRTRVLEQLRKDYYSLLVTVAWHLADWHVLFHALTNPSLAAQAHITLDEGRLQLKINPAPRLPRLTYQLELPWPRDLSLPLRASELLKFKGLQRLYRYHVALWEILAPTQQAVAQLYDNPQRNIQEVLAQWDQLPQLPTKIAQQVTTATAKNFSWQNNLERLQPIILAFLEHTYNERKALPNKITRCAHNFLAAAD